MSFAIALQPETPAPEEVQLRPARLTDVLAIEAVQHAAVRRLAARDYTRRQCDAFVGELGTLDRSLIEDGSYAVAVRSGRIVGCGGWSFRDQGHGDAGPARRLDPAREAAWMRAFFVHPDFERRGIAGQLLRAAEARAFRAGFARAQLEATPTGEPVYVRHGYEVIARTVVITSGGVALEGAHMEKRLAG